MYLKLIKKIFIYKNTIKTLKIENDNYKTFINNIQNNQLENYYENERINDDYRSKNYYNLCKIKGCMYLTAGDFCKNHMINKKYI